VPLPSPRKNEDKNRFINRCMESETMKREFPDTDQRVAVCHDRWRKRDREKED